jgi:hypothetical protein
MLQRLGESKCLRADQIANSINSVNVRICFEADHPLLIRGVQDPPAVQGAKVILGLYALHNRLDAFEMGKPPFAVSDDTEVSFSTPPSSSSHSGPDQHLFLRCCHPPFHQIERVQGLGS